MNAILNADGLHSENGMGSLGKITSLKDLPPDKKMLTYYRHAAELILTGQRTTSLVRPKEKKSKPALEVPAELTAALKKNKTAAKVFDAFSPSCQREYADWITEAKRPETKEKRITQAVEWIAEGKQRNWKYQNC
jgi:uncharacterized protein YdeI (YjbR/CyaY-like superfamily)